MLLKALHVPMLPMAPQPAFQFVETGGLSLMKFVTMDLKVIQHHLMLKIAYLIALDHCLVGIA